MPTRICKNCYENLEIARNVRKLVRESDKYLKDLLVQGAVSFVADQNLDILNISTENDVKVEKDEGGDVGFTYEDLDSYINESESNLVVPEQIPAPFNDPATFNLDAKLNTMSDLGNIKNEISEEIEVKVSLNEMMENITDTDPTKSKSKRVKYKAQDTTVHQCLVCGKVYKNKYILKAHENRHFPQPPPSVLFTCDICNRSFTKKVNIYRHMQGVHFKEKK